VSNPLRNPDHTAPLPDSPASARRGWPILAAPLVCLMLTALSPLPVAAQDTAAVAAPAEVPSPPHRHKKSTANAGREAAKEPGKAKDSGSEGGDNGAFPGLTSSKGPINIKSDTLSLDYKGKAVLFSGHVHAVQSGSELTSDKLHIDYEQNFKDVKDMTADGNVRIVQGGRWATSDHAVLNQKIHSVVMTGNPVVHDGPDQIAGDRITVYLDTGKSVVEHAHALIFPRQSQTPDNGTSEAASTGAQSTAVDPAASGAAAEDSSGPPEASGQ
jgi:lipopolysaccharide export system protein LptA